jgi:hypothetical protein
VAEQIRRLEERHRALVEETGAELELLKVQLAEGNNIEEHVEAAKTPLLEEIAFLRAAIAQSEQGKTVLKTELERLQNDYQAHYTDVQKALASLGSLMDTPQVAVAEPLPEVTNENLEALLAEFSDAPAKDEIAEPSPVVLTEVLPEPIVEKPRKERKPRSFKWMKRLAVRTVALALVGTAGWAGLQAIQKKNASAEVGQVAGATSDGATDILQEKDPAEKYKESYAIVPFDRTEWETYTDIDFGVSFRYPTNATNISKTIGGSNIWFLRFNGYMMKISKEDTQDSLDTWWEKSANFYTDGATAAKGVFKSRPAWIITPTEVTKTSGTTYVVATKTGVMQVWVKDEDPQTDDGQRIAKMLESLTFSQ